MPYTLEKIYVLRNPRDNVDQNHYVEITFDPTRDTYRFNTKYIRCGAHQSNQLHFLLSDATKARDEYIAHAFDDE